MHECVLVFMLQIECIGNQVDLHSEQGETRWHDSNKGFRKLQWVINIFGVEMQILFYKHFCFKLKAMNMSLFESVSSSKCFQIVKQANDI